MITTNQRRLRLLTAPLLVALTVMLFMPAGTAHAGHMDRFGLIQHTWDGLAIKGYDPVAYFDMGEAVKGSEHFRYEWLGQEWRFASAEHRDLFASNPIKYVPQYGGYCSERHTVAEVNPTAWQIVGGRLYLFFSEKSAERFARDERAQSKLERNWEIVKDGLSQ